ncbi:hypothetical protein [Micromonospora sp. CPCC 206061]|uniref:hypothetical protein n=1 Tax=Micromonospora sp. CPCC 206061 TaxID=3122410 RepID=UPI002FF1F0AF
MATVVARRSRLNMAVRKEKVWRWEKGLAVPEPPAQYALADELGVARHLVDACPWPDWLLLVDPEEPTTTAWTTSAAADTIAKVVESAVMDRRGFLIMSGSAATGLAAAWSAAEPQQVPGLDRGRVTPDMVDHMHARLEQLWHLDDVLGGGACLAAGVADLRLVENLIRTGNHPAELGGRLWSLAAAQARFCGWAAFDAGLQAAAQRFWHAALRAAAVASDVDQGVYVLSNLALQSAYAGDGATAVGLLEVARRRVDPAARTVLAMLDCWSARAHALSGDATTAAVLINQADDLYDRRRDGDDPDWVYWMPQPSLTAEAGTALLAINDLPAAERSLGAGLDTLDADSTRDRNLYLVRIAETQLRTNRIDEADATARAAIDAATGIDSARVQQRLDALLKQFPAGDPRTQHLSDYRMAAHQPRMLG